MASLEQLIVAVPGAGRHTLLAALQPLADGQFPENLRLCVLDAERMDAPAQIALVDELAADPLLDVIFALNKADRFTGPRTALTRTLALLRERGFPRPTLYPICARAAMLFSLPPEQIAGAELMSELGNLYFRYSPGEQSLSAFAVTRESALCLGSREITPEQLRLAVTNTGVPALAAALEALRLPEEAPLTDVTETDEPVGALTERPPEAEPTDEAVGAATGRPPEAEPTDEAVGAATGRPPEAEPTDEAVGAATGRPPEAEPTDEPAGAATGRPPEAEPTDEPVGGGALDALLPDETETDEPAGAATGRPPEAEPTDEPVGAATGRPPEAEPTDEPVGGGVLDAPLPDDAETDEPAGRDALIAPTPFPAASTAEETPSEDPLDHIENSDAEDPLGELLSLAKTANCAELLELARSVPAVKASDELRDQALDVLHAAYQTRQTEELDALTAGTEALGLDELRTLADRITAGPYTVQARTPYTARLNERIDAIQSAELTDLCAGVETADARTLNQIREALDQMDCAEVLKTEHYHRVEARQEKLDLEALDRVTAGAEGMDEKELRALAVTLEANNWNPKFVTGYRHRINQLIEASQYREVQELLADLDDMERREVLELRERLAEKSLPARFTAGAAARIEEKLYRLDMLRLMALNNDLESLDFEGLDELRAIVGRGDYAERAKNEYLDRLLVREKALILENTSARAELTRQLIAQHKLRMSDFTLSTSSRDFDERLRAFWGGTGLEQPRDIPVFLFDNASDYAMTGTRFYYKSGRDLAFVPIENIDHFQVMRQHLSLNLQIVGKDNSYRLTDARISRSGSERVLEFLNDCVSRWAEPGPPTSRGISAEYRLPRLDAADYTAPVELEPPTAREAGEQFRAAYESARLRCGTLVSPEDSSGMDRLRRLRQNFGLPENVPVIWYESASRLGPVKEGAAIGPRAVYLKEGKLPLRTIPVGEIFEIRASGSRRVTVTSLRNETLTLETADDMAPLLADYVRTLQLGDWLRGSENKV